MLNHFAIPRCKVSQNLSLFLCLFVLNLTSIVESDKGEVLIYCDCHWIPNNYRNTSKHTGKQANKNNHTDLCPIKPVSVSKQKSVLCSLSYEIQIKLYISQKAIYLLPKYSMHDDGESREKLQNTYFKQERIKT